MRRWSWVVVIATACGSGNGGDGGSDSGNDGGSSSGGATSVAESEGSTSITTVDAGSETLSDSGSDDSVDSSGSGSADSGSSDGGTTGNQGSCDPPVTQSACGNPNSIVRGTATVGAGAPTSGALLVTLSHQYLGEGASGGIYHSSATIPAVDFSAGPVPFELDMCLGGEMWSEENCEFQIAVTLDVNGNGLVDAGDPTGTSFVFVSCTGDNPCLELALECSDGSSCVAFTDPAYCSCPGNGGMCNSPIVAC